MDSNTATVDAPVSAADANTPAPASSGMDDWASRLDADIDSLNQEEKATKYGKPDPKPDGDSAKSAAKKLSKKAAKATDRSSEKPAEQSPEEAAKDAPEEAEQKPEVTNPEDTEKKSEDPPKGLTEKAAVKWGELRAEAAKAKEYAKEIETLKAELETAKAASNASELEQLRQLNAEYERELSVARVESTQEYKANVVEPMVGIVGYVRSLAEKYELNPQDLLTAFAESDSGKQSDLIADLAGNMNERDRLRLYAASDDYAEILRRRDLYQESSRETLNHLENSYRQAAEAQKAAQAQEAADARAAYEKATEKVFGDLKKSVAVLADEEVASDVQRLAKGDYSSADPELKSYLAHSGALLPHLLKALKAAQSELAEANKKIVGYRNSSPKAEYGSSDGAKDLDGDVSFLDALEQQLG